ncbi:MULTISPECIES: aspartyl-phosphate phosphatase Spo0E family protein [Paenibacillus]|uniref:aspartyl-phosphate phosphatase Spo0E family protein n=1 Tax=Paenibacillus TaxID=44249 RepID=UPI0022B89321|nr:aspartyl-phosphate phosphatase Spo0E family protein [Paenibacillus caseinilyticus]MCZ8521134.1 aspartyl-phosphate phosphatase Spo0E family protein [Paenibacillus caseinilyticus]
MRSTVMAKIESLRSELNELAPQKEKLVDGAVVRLSQELDKMIMDYYRSRARKADARSAKLAQS